MNPKTFFWLTPSFFLLTLTQALAEAREALPEARFSSTSYFWVLFKTTLSLLFVLGLIFILAKFLLAKSPTYGPKKNFFIFDRVSLEPQVSLYLVKVAQKIFLIGVGGKRVVLIESLRAENFPEANLSEIKSGKKFADFLGRFSEQFKNKENE